MHLPALDQLLDQAPGDYSLCATDLAGGELYAYQADVVRPAASLIKVPLALALYELADAGMLDLDQELLVLPDQRVEGDGTLDAGVPEAGARRTLRQLVEHSLVESDNTASNLLIEQAGMARVNEWLDRHGCAQTRLQRRFMDFEAARAGRENLTTAREQCRIFGLLSAADASGELRGYLRRAIGDQKLVAGLPPGTPVAHKLGDLPGAEHDAGIVELPAGPLLVAALSVGLRDSETGQRAIAAATRLLYEALARGPAA